ncbi:MAG: hypothetical protein E7401_03245 [Ruminococcaceae bacterium]|nr:hypothetical protein [Oscillospiraceae bacterium]
MKKEYREYSSIEATREVVGCVLLNPSLLKNYKISHTDFTKQFYQYVFLAIEHLYKEGATEISPLLIEEYLRSHKTRHANFQRDNGIEVLKLLVQKVTPANFEYHYQLIKKFSLLRELKKNGVDVSYYFDPEEVDVEICSKKRELLENTSVDDIYLHYKELVDTAAAKCSVDLGYTESEAISDIDEYLSFLQDNAYGLPFSSAYLNTVTNGQQRGKLYVISASSGVGKTRNLIGNLCHSFAPRYYNNGEWLENVSGTDNKALYIGTEMDLKMEIVPIIIAYLSNVDEGKIKKNALDGNEQKRVKEALKVYNEMTDIRGNIKLIDFPEYTMASLKAKITEAVNKNGVTHVYLDYIHTTAALLSEFSQSVGKGYSVREDQALTEVSKMLKVLAKKLNICIVACTQITGDADKESKNAQLIRGSKAIIDKADVGIIYSRPNDKEKESYESIFSKSLIKRTPNLIVSVYKNRGGMNLVKIFLEVDYGTMRVHDIIMMDVDNKKIDADKTYLKMVKDKIVAHLNKK